jgi:hypothetical protein
MTNPVAAIALVDSAAEFLQPGEEIIAFDDRHAVDFWKGRRGIDKLDTPVGVRFSTHQVGVVITTRRFLMFRLGGLLLDRAQEVLTDIPVSQVDSIEYIGHALRSFEVKLTIQGTEYGFIVAHLTDRMGKGLEIAKQRAADDSG